MKNLKITLIAILIATANSFAQTLPQTLKYDFKFDWLATYKINTLDISETDVMSIGYCRLFVKNKNTGNDDQVQPTGFSYIGNYGRVFEIGEKNAFSMKNRGVRSLMNSSVRFQFEPSKYGYKTLNDLYDNAYFKIVAEVKIINKLGKVFPQGKVESIIFLKNANIGSKTIDAARNSSNSPTGNGFFRFNSDDNNIGMLYSIKPVN